MSAAHRPLTLWLVATLASINVHLATDSEQRPVVVVVLHNYAAIAPAILEHAARSTAPSRSLGSAFDGWHRR